MKKQIKLKKDKTGNKSEKYFEFILSTFTVNLNEEI